MGLLDANKQDMAPDQELDDPILKRIESEIEAKVPPEMKDAYLGAVIAGMRVMFDEKTAHLIDQQLQESDDIVKNVSEGIAKLIGILYNESQGKIEVPALLMASIPLMCQALDYGQQKFEFEITDELIAEATKATMFEVLGIFGMDRASVEQQIAANQQAGQPEMAGA